MINFSLKKKLLPSLMAAALASGVTFSGGAQAIQVAANGIGQVLLAPIYQATQPGEKTLITIINTSQTHAAKVKAVFRSRKYSIEVLDFLIYLTPGDVWRGEVYHKEGHAWLRSSDDSIRNLPNTNSFANLQPVDIQLFDQRLAKDAAGNVIDDNETGHIEFIGHYSVAPSVPISVSVGSPNPITISRGMSKFDIARLFEMYTGEITSLNSVLCPNTGLYPGISNPNCPVRVDDPDHLVLRGEVELVTGGERMAYVMTALASSRMFDDYAVESTVQVPFDIAYIDTWGSNDGSNDIVKVDEIFGANRVTGSHVISNPNLNINVATQTALGANWGFSRGEIVNPLDPLGSTFVGIYDNILEIEHAIATWGAAGSYENGTDFEASDAAGWKRYTGIQVTFPTKYRHRLSDPCETGTQMNIPLGQHSPPFTLNGDVRFKSVSFDNSENTATTGTSVSGSDVLESVITDEVNMLLGSPAAPLFSYPSGFYSIEFNPTAGPNGGCPYYGVPAIVHSYKYTVAPDSTTHDHLLLPASSDSWRWQ